MCCFFYKDIGNLTNAENLFEPSQRFFLSKNDLVTLQISIFTVFN